MLALEKEYYLPGIASSGAASVGAISSMPMPLGIVGDLDIMSNFCESINGYATHGGGSSLYFGAISSIGNTTKDV